MGLFLVGCETDDDGDDDHILVGDWELSGMSQYSNYTLAADYPVGGGQVMPAGMPLGDGTKGWSYFSDTLMVSATVNLKNDFTFTLSGDLPSASDTLGWPPNVVNLNDQGTWQAAEDLSTLLIDGALYDIGGLATYDNIDDPTMITLAYSSVTARTMVIPMSPAGPFLDAASVSDSSATVLEFTRQ